MRTLYLVRHAETAWNVDMRYQGQTDIPLNDAGRKQAGELRARIERRKVLFDPTLTAVITSDLSRARESAEIAFLVPGREHILEPGLRELSYGKFEGLSREEIKHNHAEEFARFSRDQSFVIEGGEARATGRTRAIEAIERALRTLPHGNVVAMTHGGIIRQLLLHTFQDGELPTHIGFGNMSIHSIHIDEQGWTYAGSI